MGVTFGGGKCVIPAHDAVSSGICSFPLLSHPYPNHPRRTLPNSTVLVQSQRPSVSTTLLNSPNGIHITFQVFHPYNVDAKIHLAHQLVRLCQQPCQILVDHRCSYLQDRKCCIARLGDVADAQYVCVPRPSKRCPRWNGSSVFRYGGSGLQSRLRLRPWTLSRCVTHASAQRAQTSSSDCTEFGTPYDTHLRHIVRHAVGGRTMEGWNMSAHKLSSRCSIIVSLGRPPWDLHKAAAGKGSEPGGGLDQRLDGDGPGIMVVGPD